MWRKFRNELRKHNIYLTATQTESWNDHRSVYFKGLPILYCKECGAIKEMCNNVGEESAQMIFIKLALLINMIIMFKI